MGKTMTKTTEKYPQAVLLLEPLQIQTGGSPKVVLAARVMLSPEPWKIRTAINNPVESLEVRLVAWADPGRGPSNSLMSVEYRDVYSADLRRAKQMVAKLAAIEKAMANHAARFGGPADGADLFMRAVNAIGAKWIVEREGPSQPMHDDNDHKFWTLQDGAGRVRRILHDGLEQIALSATPPQQ
jgi:hypothetical protein